MTVNASYTAEVQHVLDVSVAPSGVWHACSDAAWFCEFLLSTVDC